MPYKKLHLWLAADGLLLLLYRLLRGNRPLVNALTEQVTGPLRRMLGRASYLTDVSIMEVLDVLAILAGLAYLVWTIRAVTRAAGRQEKLRRAYGGLLGFACAGLSVWAVFCFLWGLGYWADGFQEKSGIYAQPVAQEDLLVVTAYFAEQTARAAEGVPRDEAGRFAVPREDILTDSVRVYDGVTETFPFLAFDDPGVKAMRFSRIMSALDFTGVYCAYTGESNVNVDSPACILPSTVAHELGHQRGFVSEQECNFLSILASTSSGLPAYEYSGWLQGYIYLGNALYPVDPDSYWAIREALPENVQQDLKENNEYWAQFRNSAARRASNKIYDGILKGYGDERGIQSYGTVVDLLVVYYLDEAQTES